MRNPSQIRVLAKFDPFLRLLKAFNSDSFRCCTNWRCSLRSVFYSFSSTVIIVMMFIWIVLLAWHLLENHANPKRFVASVPILATLLQITFTFIDLMMKNKMIAETIEQFQRVVDQRESANFLESFTFCVNFGGFSHFVVLTAMNLI